MTDTQVHDKHILYSMCDVWWTIYARCKEYYTPPTECIIGSPPWSSDDDNEKKKQNIEKEEENAIYSVTMALPSRQQIQWWRQPKNVGALDEIHNIMSFDTMIFCFFIRLCCIWENHECHTFECTYFVNQNEFKSNHIHQQWTLKKRFFLEDCREFEMQTRFWIAKQKNDAWNK